MISLSGADNREFFKNIVFNNRILYSIYIKIKLICKNQDKSSISKFFLASILPANPIILEIGAHVGSDTVEMAVLWPKGRIYAFEPIQNIFDRLVIKTRKFQNIEVIQAAITDHSNGGKGGMYVSNNSDCSSSLLKPKDHLLYCPNIGFSDEKVSIDTLVLSDWLDERGIKSVDLIWIDVQGMELKIFKSLGEKINIVDCIYTEVSLREFYEGSGNYDEIKEYLSNYGFVVVSDDLGEGQLMGNALFKKVK